MSSLHNCERTHFCSFKPPVYGTFSRQLYEANTSSSGFLPHSERKSMHHYNKIQTSPYLADFSSYCSLSQQSTPTTLEHYLWVSPAFSDSCSWNPGMTNRTMLIQSQKTFLFQGLWLITKVVNGKPWTRIYEFLGGGPWMSLFPYN